MATTTSLTWHRVLGADELPEGRVTTVTAGHLSLALTHVDGTFAALDNHCPHQGGPLGEGSIENGLLRCPWHGYDYCPLTGQSPGAFGDEVLTHPVEVREDGGIYVGVPADRRTSARSTTSSCETLVAWGVRHVFGMVGHSNLGLADAIRRRVQDGEMEYIGIRHEGAAAFAASAYGKLTGRPAACLTIAGPGATNLLTGMWDAKVDRSPVLALTGQVQTSVLGVHNFQEVDLGAAFDAVADWSQTVLPDSPHAELVSLACKHAILRQGVSHLVFPDEVQTIPAAEGVKAGGPDGRLTALRDQPAGGRARRRGRADRGGEAAGDHRRRGRALRDGRRRRARRARGRAGHHDVQGEGPDRRRPPARVRRARALRDAGRELGHERGRPARRARRVVLEPHRASTAATRSCRSTSTRCSSASSTRSTCRCGARSASRAARWWRDCPTSCRRSASTSARSSPSAGRSGAWRRRRGAWTTAATASPARTVFDSLSRLTPEDTVIAVDVGNNTYSFGRYFECRPGQRVLMSGYLGSIGFGYPAAIGAWAATGGEHVLCVTGDGGFGQYMMELLTAVKHGMNITHVLLNNGQLGKISKEQQAGSWDVWETSLHNPDFSEYARICGALGIRVTSADELDDAIARAMAHDGPALVEVMTDPELI